MNTPDGIRHDASLEAGWAEILVTSFGYEGQAITAYEYTDSGLQPTGAALEGGC